MRYFVVSNSGVVIQKQAFSGTSNIDSLVASFQANHPNLVVLEVDQPTFDSTLAVSPPTAVQTAWANLKASSPTAFQAITFIAKYLNLE